MDRCVRVKAVASGNCSAHISNNFDRNTGWGTWSSGLTRSDTSYDGTYAFYYHLMKKSVTVKPGEYVAVGQTIDGSSGNSTDAYLHFLNRDITPEIRVKGIHGRNI
ncbi:MAG: M23 family metallopeptidase [Ignavibacteria bacterium]